MSGRATTAAATDTASLSTLSDLGLVVAVGRGRPEALAEVYARYGGSVYDLARRLCEPSAAEEVVREVFLALWHSPMDFDPARGSLVSHLLADAHSRSAVVLRADTARRTREAAISAEELEFVVMNIGTREEPTVDLSDLPDAERRAVILAYFGGFTYQQVAAALDQSDQIVKAHIDAGLRCLRAEQAGPAASSQTTKRSKSRRGA
jgi:RNA polymerase sigma-70 factor (ECF subfamily)